MANAVEKLKEKVAKAPALQKATALDSLLRSDHIQERFKRVLGGKAPAFTASILSLYNESDSLKSCDPVSILSSAMIAATLDLPINSNLGFAHIVPYKDKASFQMGWKGFVQLAIRTGQYKTMNASEVYEGELTHYDRVTGDVNIDQSKRTSDKIIGYVAFFRLINGFEKYLYMTKEQVTAHGKRYSQSFRKGFGPWVDLFDAMALKTVMKMLLSKYGILSIELQKAVTADQGVSEDIDSDNIVYPDATDDGFAAEETAPSVVLPSAESKKEETKDDVLL